LMQMDGLRGGKLTEQVFVMAASNLPWDLDVAVLRRQ
jgi:SpoVK/Ycf46/Vps4 family AAA+-type ATPase